MAGAQEAEEAGGIAALGFNLPGLVAQLINFAILLFVLRLFLYKPVLRIIDERKRRIEEGLNRAEQAAEQASASEEEARRVTDEARAEGREIVARAQQTADRLRAELEERARTDAEQIVTRAREEIAVRARPGDPAAAPRVHGPHDDRSGARYRTIARPRRAPAPDR